MWNQFAQVLTRHGSDPQNIKFAYSMEELMLQLAFYGGYTILAVHSSATGSAAR